MAVIFIETKTSNKKWVYLFDNDCYLQYLQSIAWKFSEAACKSCSLFKSNKRVFKSIVWVVIKLSINVR